MLGGLVVHSDKMLKNLHLTDGLVNTEAVMMALAPTMGREVAHDKLSKICIAVSEGKGRLIDLLSQDAEITKTFDRSALEKLVDPENYLGNSALMVDHLLERRK